jgi:hypothetical protein
LQSILENYWGSFDGTPVRIFEAALVDPDTGAASSLPLEGDADHPGALTAPPRPDRVSQPPQAPGGPQSGPGAAQHGDDESGYSGLNNSELLEIIAERGLSAPSGATKAVLVSILEDHDAQGGQS